MLALIKIALICIIVWVVFDLAKRVTDVVLVAVGINRLKKEAKLDSIDWKNAR